MPVGVADTVKAIFEAITRVPDSIEAYSKVRVRRVRKRRLRRALESEEYRWRSVSTLARLIGRTEEETRELLLELDARPSLKPGSNEELWGLVSRVGEG